METVFLVIATYLAAGTVKGVVGLGLPTVSLAVLATTLGLREAIAVVLLPSLLTNIWQAVSGGHFRELLRRLWGFLLAGALVTPISTAALAAEDTTPLKILLGVLIAGYAVYSLVAPHLPEPGRRERWMAPLAGGATAVLGGLTGAFAIPAVPYLQALRLTRDQMVQALGIWFTVVTVLLGVGMGGRGLIALDMALLSSVAVLPAFLGMRLGQVIRARIAEESFRRAFLVVLFFLGVLMIVRSVFW